MRPCDSRPRREGELARAALTQPAPAVQGIGVGAAAWDRARCLQQSPAPHAPCWRRPAFPEKVRTCSTHVKFFTRRGRRWSTGACSGRCGQASCGQEHAHARQGVVQPPVCPLLPCTTVDSSRILAPWLPQEQIMGARSHRSPRRGSRIETSALRRMVGDRAHVTRTPHREEETYGRPQDHRP